MNRKRFADGWSIINEDSPRLKNEKPPSHERVVSQPPGWLSDWRLFDQRKSPGRTTLSTYQSTQGTVEIVIEPPESVEKNSGSVQLDPANLDHSTVGEYLTAIEAYHDRIKADLYWYSKELYLDEVEEHMPEDIINIGQIISYAEANEHDEWIPELKTELEDYFANLDINRDLMKRAIKDGESISPDRARDLYDKEGNQIENAIESVYDGLSAEEQQKIIQAEKKELLWKIINKIGY